MWQILDRLDDLLHHGLGALVWVLEDYGETADTLDK